MFSPGHRPQFGGKQRCYVIISNGLLLCRDNSPWSPLSASSWLALQPQPPASEFCIGEYAGRDCFAAVLADNSGIPGYHWVNLYQLMPLLDETHYQVVARAFQLRHWQEQHRYCGSCGSPVLSHSSELAKHCPDCELFYYPRLSPCVMMLVCRGDHCLLARNTRFPAGMFSVLAGFIEVGETVEMALRREVREEVGLEVSDVSYFGSQSWPFPSQLMLGFHAEYGSGNIVEDRVEIEEANWFHYRRLPQIPNRTTLSGQLIEAFVNRCSDLHNG